MNKLTTWCDKDYDKFVVGKDYWTFYMETTRDGESLRNVVKVFKTRVKEKRPSTYHTCGFELVFEEFPTTLKLGRTMRHNLRVYMCGYGTAYCDYYETEKEAQDGFDARIVELAQYKTASVRDYMYSKMYTKIAPKTTVIERESKAWKATLTPKQLEYFQWLKDNNQ